jgi:excisionase family DNA binding protein
MTTSTGGPKAAEFISVADATAELHVTQRFVRRLIADGELHAVKIGTRLVRIRRDDLEAALRPVRTRSSHSS